MLQSASVDRGKLVRNLDIRETDGITYGDTHRAILCLQFAELHRRRLGAGHTVWGYRLVTLLGRGGMGEVWRAHDTETDRVVAIKLLPPYLSGDEEFKQRFRREAHAAARLNDPHVIPIHNYGEIDGQLYVDMRLIEGRDLQTVLADGALDPVRAVLIIDQVAKALHAAHEVGLLHRDIKPSNILLDRNDFAYLIDFGIARAIEETRMTKSGDTIGTFQYIAPERLETGTEDARADIYSLACVLYESLTGQPPFPGSSTAQLINAHLNTPPASTVDHPGRCAPAG
jgi:serine/threonine protein kinase